MDWNEGSYDSYKDSPKHLMLTWLWLVEYKSFPFEIFFAISDSLKYIQFVYLAKWVNRQHLITVIGSWFMMFGFLNILNNYL